MLKLNSEQIIKALLYSLNKLQGCLVHDSLLAGEVLESWILENHNMTTSVNICNAGVIALSENAKIIILNISCQMSFIVILMN